MKKKGIFYLNHWNQISNNKHKKPLCNLVNPSCVTLRDRSIAPQRYRRSWRGNHPSLAPFPSVFWGFNGAPRSVYLRWASVSKFARANSLIIRSRGSWKSWRWSRMHINWGLTERNAVLCVTISSYFLCALLLIVLLFDSLSRIISL